MRQVEAFLQDVCEHPEDDAPRLVYADWLDDHGGPGGQEQAEFIRVQCGLARMPEEERPSGLLAREADILRRHRGVWLRPIKKVGTQVEFVRGFVGRITLTASKFLAAARQDHSARLSQTGGRDRGLF